MNITLLVLVTSFHEQQKVSHIKQNMYFTSGIFPKCILFWRLPHLLQQTDLHTFSWPAESIQHIYSKFCFLY